MSHDLLSNVPFRKLNRFAAAAICLIALSVYLRTVAPTVSFWAYTDIVEMNV